MTLEGIMKIKNERVRRRRYLTVEKSKDPILGLAILHIAERWADALERLLETGAELSEVAEATHAYATNSAVALELHGKICDVMVEYLEDCWRHYGSALARWYKAGR
jgi:hypothetical protein